MKIGFVGTKYGLSVKQQITLINFLQKISHDFAFDVNDANLIAVDRGCIGSDYQFHTFAIQLGFKSICYPGLASANADLICRPEISKYSVIKEADYFKENNKKLIDSCDFLIAAPSDFSKIDEIGQAISYAKKTGKKYMILKR